MPEILADWGWVAAIMSAAGVMARLIYVGNQVDDNRCKINSLEAFTTEFREWRAGFDQWKNDHMIEERQRSKRMDAITSGVEEMSKAFNKVVKEHEGRISRGEGRMNGSG